MGQADGSTTTKNACRLSVLSPEDTRGATAMRRLDMHHWRAGYSESCTVSSVGGRRKRAKPLVPRRRPTQLNKGGKARPKGCDTSHWLATFVPVHGYTWSGPVRCFTEASSRLDCTLVARWDEDYQDPWLIVTDLLPTQADVAWYAMRAWIECGFKDTKRGGWTWHHTKMEDPGRAEQHWLVMAVATLWVVSVGGERDASQPASTLAALPETYIARTGNKGRKKPRKMSCFARGMMLITVALLQGRSLPTGRFVPFVWPTFPEIAWEASNQAEREKTYP